MITGMLVSKARIRASNSSPFIPGMMTSVTTASTRDLASNSSASCALAATDTEKPSDRNSSSSICLIARSSSTTRIRSSLTRALLLRRSRPNRQEDLEGRPGAESRAHVEPSAVLLDDPMSDGESEAGAAAGFLRRIERVEHPRDVFGSDPDTAVGEGDRHAGLIGLPAIRMRGGHGRHIDLEPPPVRHRVQSVGRKIQKHVLQVIGVGDQGGQIPVHGQLHDHSLAFASVVQREGRLQCGAHVDRQLPAGPHPSERQHVADDPGDPLALRDDDAEVPIAGLALNPSTTQRLRTPR